MPSVVVYIRSDDYDKWKAIQKKSEWISKRLNTPGIPISSTKRAELNKLYPPKIGPDITYEPIDMMP